MDVIIEEVVGTVRAVDSHALLDPRTLARIVEAVSRAIDEKGARDQRWRNETRIGAGQPADQVAGGGA